MQQNDIRTLKRKLDAIYSNIKIYQHDLKRYETTLKKKYSITDTKDAENLVDELEVKVKKYRNQQNKILGRAARLIKKIKVSND
jgi:predicted DNA-binding protein YlxM (UPF0122 family)